MTRRSLAAAAVLLLGATACQDRHQKSGATPTEPVSANASVAGSASRASSVCAAYDKERETRRTVASTKRCAEADAATAEITALDAVIADACGAQ